MTPRTTGTIAAGMLAIGIAVGAAGTIAANDGTTNDSSGFMGATAGMNAGMMGSAGMGGSETNAGTMADMARMMSTMGAGTSTSPDPASSPENHELHHGSPSPSATR